MRPSGSRITSTLEDTEIYVDPATFEDRGLLVALQAQPALRTGNLRAIEPPGPLAMETTVNERQAGPTAPLLLIYAELRYRGTDQAREAADLLLPKLLNDVTARA